MPNLEDKMAIDLMVEFVNDSEMPLQDDAGYEETLITTASIFGRKYTEKQFKAVAIYGEDAEKLLGSI